MISKQPKETPKHGLKCNLVLILQFYREEGGDHHFIMRKGSV